MLDVDPALDESIVPHTHPRLVSMIDNLPISVPPWRHLEVAFPWGTAGRRERTLGQEHNFVVCLAEVESRTFVFLARLLDGLVGAEIGIHEFVLRSVLEARITRGIEEEGSFGGSWRGRHTNTNGKSRAANEITVPCLAESSICKTAGLHVGRF